jgi:hypothetical protein
MKGFIAGFATCWYINKHASQINAKLEEWIAKLELKRDLLKHDNNIS